jgi:hypothetical protein
MSRPTGQPRPRRDMRAANKLPAIDTGTSCAERIPQSEVIENRQKKLWNRDVR